MATPSKYPDELQGRAIRMVMDARKDPATRPRAFARIGSQLGMNAETLRNWVTQTEIDGGTCPGTTTGEARGSPSSSEKCVSCGGRSGCGGGHGTRVATWTSSAVPLARRPPSGAKKPLTCGFAGQGLP